MFFSILEVGELFLLGEKVARNYFLAIIINKKIVCLQVCSETFARFSILINKLG